MAQEKEKKNDKLTAKQKGINKNRLRNKKIKDTYFYTTTKIDLKKLISDDKKERKEAIDAVERISVYWDDVYAVDSSFNATNITKRKVVSTRGARKLTGMEIYTWNELWNSGLNSSDLILKPGIGESTIKSINILNKFCGVKEI